MFEVVESRKFRTSVHFRVLVGVIPIWIVSVFVIEYFLGGAREIFQQNSALVVGAIFFFLLDFWTAVIYRIWIRGEEKFTSGGLATGAKKLGLWIVIGAGATIWSNTFPHDPQQVRWYDPRWLGANVDLLGFLYMYAMDTISSIENVTGKAVGDTGIGRFIRSIISRVLPYLEDDLSEMRTDV